MTELKNTQVINNDIGAIWVIKTDIELDNNDIQFLKDYRTQVYFNDMTCKYWVFDFQLPSGRYIENVEIVEKNDSVYCYGFSTIDSKLPLMTEEQKRYIYKMADAIVS